MNNKRLISMVLTFAIVISCMSFSVSADSENWYDLLEYGYPVGLSGNRAELDGSGNQRFYFDNPGGYFVNTVDITFRTDTTLPQVGTSSAYLTVENLYADVWRAYGYINSSDDLLRITYEYTDGTFIEFYRVNVSSVRWDWQYLDCYGYITGGYPADQTMSYSRDPVDRQWTIPNDISDTSYLVEFTFGDWTKYDYIELVLSIHAEALNSIDVVQGVRVLPVEKSFTDSLMTGQQRFFVTLRIPLADADKISIDTLKITLGLSAIRVSSGVNMVRIYTCRGIYEAANPNVFVYWFESLRGWFRELIIAVGGSADTSDMETEVDQIKDQMQEASDIMSDFTRPNVDEVFQNVELDIGNGTPFADMMREFFENEFIVSIITGSLAFTLFGILVG